MALLLQLLGKDQNKLQVSRRKEITKIRAEINEMDTIKQLQINLEGRRKPELTVQMILD